MKKPCEQMARTCLNSSEQITVFHVKLFFSHSYCTCLKEPCKQMMRNTFLLLSTSDAAGNPQTGFYTHTCFYYLVHPVYIREAKQQKHLQV